MKRILITSTYLIYSVLANAQKVPSAEKHPIRDWVFNLSLYFVCIAIPLYAAIMIFKVISENKFRNHLLDKDISDETIKLIINNGNRRLRLEVIMWALLFSFVGITIFLTQFLKVGRLSSIGLILMAVALALFVFYSLAKKKI